MAAFVRHQESETFACSHLRGSFRVTRPSPFPTRTAAGHQVSPHPYGLRAQEEPHTGVWCGRRDEGGWGRHKRGWKGRGLQVPACSLSGKNEIHIRCGVIKKQMTQCRAVFRRFTLLLQMAHSRRSHQPPLHSHIPPSERYKHTHADKDTHTQPSLVSPSGIEKRPLLKCFPVEVTT